MPSVEKRSATTIRNAKLCDGTYAAALEEVLVVAACTGRRMMLFTVASCAAAACSREHALLAQASRGASSSARPLGMAIFNPPDPLGLQPGKLPKALDAFDPGVRWTWPGLASGVLPG